MLSSFHDEIRFFFVILMEFSDIYGKFDIIKDLFPICRQAYCNELISIITKGQKTGMKARLLGTIRDRTEYKWR